MYVKIGLKKDPILGWSPIISLDILKFVIYYNYRLDVHRLDVQQSFHNPGLTTLFLRQLHSDPATSNRFLR